MTDPFEVGRVVGVGVADTVGAEALHHALVVSPGQPPATHVVLARAVDHAGVVLAGVKVVDEHQRRVADVDTEAGVGRVTDERDVRIARVQNHLGHRRLLLTRKTRLIRSISGSWGVIFTDHTVWRPRSRSSRVRRG